jgi:hypothetical protein
MCTFSLSVFGPHYVSVLAHTLVHHMDETLQPKPDDLFATSTHQKKKLGTTFIYNSLSLNFFSPHFQLRLP